MRSKISVPVVTACALLALLAGCAGSGAGVDAQSPAAASPPPSGLPPPAADTAAPSVPTGVSATTLSPVEVCVAWQASTDDVGVAGYRIFQNGSHIATTTAASYIATGLTPATAYSFSVSAYDAAGNASARSAGVSATTSNATGSVVHANPTNYLQLLRALKAGDTLVLAAGVYDNPADAPGLPIFNLNGSAAAPIIITGPDGAPRAVFLGRATHNTVRIGNSSYVVLRNLEIDGRDLGGDGVKAESAAHHITLENLLIRGVGDDQQTVGISTNGGSTWGWVIRRNTIIGAGTGMYLGSSAGDSPFVAGLIEHNLVRDTIGYNIEIKHQNVRPAISGMPTGQSSTIIRHNVFTKAANSSTGGLARPNLLVGHFPPSGVGADDVYQIYGNFFYQNPSEALFQGEGNIAFHHNLLVNDHGAAVNIEPHNDVPKLIRVFHNTVVARDSGIRVTGGSTSFTQVVIGNAVFAGTPIQASDQRQNVTASYGNAVNYVNNATGTPGLDLDLYPVPTVLKGTPVDSSAFNTFVDWDRDFNKSAQDEGWRGAYSGEGLNPGWRPALEIKPD